MRRVEFMTGPEKRLEIQEVDKNENVRICPAQLLEERPYLGGKPIKKFKVRIGYETTPIMEV